VNFRHIFTNKDDVKKISQVIVMVLFAFSNNLFAQDTIYARKIIDTLTSETFWGRGYTKDGLNKTSKFLANEFKKIGLEPANGKSYFQSYKHAVNTFPNKMNLSVNETELIAGKDFIVSAESVEKHIEGKLEQLDSIRYSDKSNAVMIVLEDKLTMTVSQTLADYTLLLIDKKSFKKKLKTYKVDLDNKFIKEFKASNICGYVKGTTYPDSIIMITAHYDHLGGMGKNVYFPGANDNASGVSLLLNLAKYYSKNPAQFTIYFILFSGEEAGLIGSEYFVEHPLLNLKNIRFLINTDLAGTGIDGITVVNATLFPHEFYLMKDINTEFRLLKTINPRGKAKNSDHYYFTEKGIPSFFIYTLGGVKAYHDVFDISKMLPLTVHADLLQLIIKFNDKLIKKN